MPCLHLGLSSLPVMLQQSSLSASLLVILFFYFPNLSPGLWTLKGAGSSEIRYFEPFVPQLKILDRLKASWKSSQDLCHHILVMYLKSQLNLAISLERYSSTKCGAGWLSPDEGSSLSPIAVCASCFARNGRTFFVIFACAAAYGSPVIKLFLLLISEVGKKEYTDCLWTVFKR